MSDKPSSYVDKLLGVSMTLVVSALSLSWAWALVQPLLPILAFGFIVYGFFRWQSHR